MEEAAWVVLPVEVIVEPPDVRVLVTPSVDPPVEPPVLPAPPAPNMVEEPVTVVKVDPPLVTTPDSATVETAVAPASEE